MQATLRVTIVWVPKVTNRSLRPRPPGAASSAGKAPVSVPLAGWNPETSDEDEPTIPYNVEWKLSINHRRRAGESEPGIDVSPRNFWKHTLQPKLVKASAKKPCQVDDTEIVMSTTHRKTRPLTGKNCNVTTITITFFYTYVGTSKPPKGSATTNQLGEIQARIGDGPVLSQGACIRKAFADRKSVV